MEKDIKKYTFLVADDHKIITQSMAFFIKDLYKDAEIIQLNKLGSILKTLHTTSVDMLVLDISFPDGNTLQIIPTIKNILPDAKILIFSGYEEEIYALRYLNAGANGYISKMSSEDEIKEAIKKVIDTGKYVSSEIQDKITDSYLHKKPVNPLEQLSDRELEIAQLLVEGYGNTQISQTLALQKSTVSTYKNRIFEKLNVENISELIQLFQLNK